MTWLLALLCCPVCLADRAQTGGAALLLAGMIAVPYLVVLAVVRAIRSEDSP
jgi:hypothetical protein